MRKNNFFIFTIAFFMLIAAISGVVISPQELETSKENQMLTPPNLIFKAAFMTKNLI